MQITYINSNELDKLRYLRHEARSLYLFLRSKVSSTGIVGYPNRISRLQLQEWLEVLPPQRSHLPFYRPNWQQVKALIALLIASGLIEKSEKMPLVFRLKYAMQDKSAQIQSNPTATPHSNPHSNPTKQIKKSNKTNDCGDFIPLQQPTQQPHSNLPQQPTSPVTIKTFKTNPPYPPSKTRSAGTALGDFASILRAKAKKEK